MEALWAGGADARALAGLKIAVIGPATAEALKPFGLKADLEPGSDYAAEGLLEALKETGLKNKKMLLIRAMEGREVLPAGLREAGAAVTDRPVYKTVNPIWSEKPPDAPDLVTFTSSSTAAGLAAFIPLEERARYRAVSIGPATTRMAKSLGFPVVAEAEKSTIDSLVRAVVQCCGAAEAPRGSLLRKNHDPV
jgi:uroporphyrinogen III methyltransferase/synthase